MENVCRFLEIYLSKYVLCCAFFVFFSTFLLFQIKKFNLELSLFVKEVNDFIQNVNEVDERTIGLLTETILCVNKLQINSKLCEKTAANQNDFVESLNNDIFQCRRYIICSLCHVSIAIARTPVFTK